MSKVDDILGPEGAIARRLGDAYEARPQQLQLAAAVEHALEVGRHLIAEAGTGVGKSFAYLVPAIDYVIQSKKRVVISTHTIALQEQLVEKDIPLIQSVYPDEFSAVLVKGRGNYLCLRRLHQTAARQYMMFDTDRQIESLNAIQDWAATTHDGSLTSLPVLPDPGVWEKVNAEQGNCMGKRCNFYDKCHWQAAKRRMQSGQLLIVNHALFFSDLALRMAGVNYLPKYDAVVFDEAHTLEDVAGQHFGMRLSEASVKYQLRSLYDPRKGSGILASHGSAANEAIQSVINMGDIVDTFFDRIAWWQETHGRPNGRVHDANVVPNELSPRLDDLTKYLKEMLARLEDNEEAIGEISSQAGKIGQMSEMLNVMLTQAMPDAVYWFDISNRTPRRVSLHAAPIDVAEGLRQQLFAKVPRVILTSATLATVGETKTPRRGMGYQSSSDVATRQGTYMPRWAKQKAVYSVCFRLADSLPQDSFQQKVAEITATADSATILREWCERYLDDGRGECLMRRGDVATIVQEQLQFFAGERYRLAAWCVMPNHVHAILQPIGEHELPHILHSWKSFTANRINKLLNRSNTVWQPEYFDHNIRDERELMIQIDCVSQNAQNAGLTDWPWCGRDEDVIAELIGNILKPEGRRPVARAAATPKTPGGQDHNAARFSFIQKRLGIDAAATLELGSPFDYQNQATLYVENDLPDPSDNHRFLPAACEKILRYLDMTGGGDFVLFTS